MLDATTKDTALKSLSQYLNVEPSYLSQTLREIQISEACDPAEYLLSYVESEFGEIQQLPKGVWFHGSRVQSPKTFWDSGICTKSDMLEELYSYLKKLSKDIPYDGEYKSGMTISERESFGKIDEGPFAYLFRDECFSSETGERDYTKMPELVQDIAGELCGENNYPKLLDIFTRNTVPCIVHFHHLLSDYEISRFIHFVYLNSRNSNFSDVISLTSCQVNFRGDSIEASRILKVEEL